MVSDKYMGMLKISETKQVLKKKNSWFGHLIKLYKYYLYSVKSDSYLD